MKSFLYYTAIKYDPHKLKDKRGIVKKKYKIFPARPISSPRDSPLPSERRRRIIKTEAKYWSSQSKR